MLDGKGLTPVRILRDTGSNVSLLSSKFRAFTEQTDNCVILRGLEKVDRTVPIVKVSMSCPLLTGKVEMALVPEFSTKYDMLLGNDLLGDIVFCPERTALWMRSNPGKSIEDPIQTQTLVTTRQQSKEAMLENETNLSQEKDIPVTKEDAAIIEDIPNLKNLFEEPPVEGVSTDIRQEVCADARSNPDKLVSSSEGNPLFSAFTAEALIQAQKEDQQCNFFLKENLTELCDMAQENTCFYLKDGILMRKHTPKHAVNMVDEYTVHQIVVPKKYWPHILKVAHDHRLSGHLGISKTVSRIQKFFYWPSLATYVRQYIRNCHACQMSGKLRPHMKPAPLQPIPAACIPFSEIVIDIVGPLPKTPRGNQYLLTLICAATRYPEAFPLRTYSSLKIIECLDNFFTKFGYPKVIRSDQGTEFTSKVFHEECKKRGVTILHSSIYHPQSAGVIERSHRTLKAMLKSLPDSDKDWDVNIKYLLFALRDAKQESLGFSPFELVFGHHIGSPLYHLYESLSGPASKNKLDFTHFARKVKEFQKQAEGNLQKAQANMKERFDRTAKLTQFNEGDMCLVYLPTPGAPLSPRFRGPFEVLKKLSDLNYVISTPEARKKSKVVHINLMKQYHQEEVHHIVNSGSEKKVEHENSDEVENETFECFEQDITQVMKSVHGLKNHDIVQTFAEYVPHLSPTQQKDILDLFSKFPKTVKDELGLTNVTSHHIVLKDPNTKPVKQAPYRLNPIKVKKLKTELDFLLQNNLIEESHSEWASPIVMVDKPNGEIRLCVDFRLLNGLTKSDGFPLPRIDDCIDQVGNAKYISKLDCLKGYHQVPLSPESRELSAFVTPFGLYQYKVLAFGLQGAPGTFQRLINKIFHDLEGVITYLDDILIISETWQEHVERLKDVFSRLSAANITINLQKSDFAKPTVVYLGHEIGQGKVRPKQANVESIRNFPIPHNRRALRRFLGMVNFFRRFCKNMASIAAPLTDLLKKDHTFKFTEIHQNSFEHLKAILSNRPVLAIAEFDKPFKVFTDASGTGIGAILAQEDEKGIDHPIMYYSSKLNKHQKNYSVIEKECLALVSAIKQFQVYISNGRPIYVFTDQNPLVFLNRMKNRNQKLLRWSLALQPYPLNIQHIAGKDNVLADALSRI